jgi:hypothetical protein
VTLATIAYRLSSVLRNMPCTCIALGAWPRFKDVKAHPERTCARCNSIAAFDAWVAAQKETKK